MQRHGRDSRTLAGWWIVSRVDADSLYCLTLRTKREADAVAAVLNYLEAKGEWTDTRIS